MKLFIFSGINFNNFEYETTLLYKLVYLELIPSYINIRCGFTVSI